jgi:UrcA family protein
LVRIAAAFTRSVAFSGGIVQPQKQALETVVIEEIAMKIPINTRSQPIASIIAITCVALASATSAGRALAEQPSETMSRVVTYGDLDLDSVQGAKVLYARLRYAAQDVCSPLESKELSRKHVWQTCVGNALESAVAQINKPTVTALHNQSVNRSSNGNS